MSPYLRILLFAFFLLFAGCGGGGSSDSPPSPPTLVSIALTPLNVTLAPGASTSLSVVGIYSDGTTRTLAASGEAFTSSDSSTVSVSSTGVATAANDAAGGTSVMIRAHDEASGLTTSDSNSTMVTIASDSNGPPTPTSATAATQTAQSNALCQAIQPFYWEIGNGERALAGGSSTPPGATPVTAATWLPIASASKWIYGMYVIEKRGGADNLNASDIKFLNFTSGYTYMESALAGAGCTPPDSGPNSINYCLSLPSMTPGKTYSSHNPATDGLFYYGPGHEENHAGQFQPEINDLDASQLGAAIEAGLGLTAVRLSYHQPLLPGGVWTSASDYAAILRAVVNGQLGMREALGTHAVCAWVGFGCDAVYSPAYTVHWHYSMAHWVEDDPQTGDGAFSSAGAFGFYPWIEANKKYYGVISRYSANPAVQDGLASAQCGHQLRAAWETGVAQ